mgnify:CR=1 FL=1
MAYLIEDWLARMARLSKKDGVKKIEAFKGSWLSNAYAVFEKQNFVV